MLTEPEALCMAEDAVNILGINAEVVGRFAGETDPEGIYSYILGGTIHALPVASMSDIYSNGSVEITGSQYSYVGYSRHYTPEEQTEAELLDFAEILEKVEIYAKAGFIRLPKNGSPVSEISLEYYVENTADGMIFYPVWNFRVSSILNSPMLLGRDTDDLFYIDAVNGMLVKSAL